MRHRSRRHRKQNRRLKKASTAKYNELKRGRPSSKKRAITKSSSTLRIRPSALKLKLGLKFLRQTKNIPVAAQRVGISTAQLRRHAVDKGVIKTRGRRWYFRVPFKRRVLIYSAGKEEQIIVRGPKAASEVGRYMSQVGHSLRMNDPTILVSFWGKYVTAVSGKKYPYETDLQILHRLVHAQVTPFEEIYKIVQ